MITVGFGDETYGHAPEPNRERQLIMPEAYRHLLKEYLAFAASIRKITPTTIVCQESTLDSDIITFSGSIEEMRPLWLACIYYLEIWGHISRVPFSRGRSLHRDDEGQSYPPIDVAEMASLVRGDILPVICLLGIGVTPTVELVSAENSLLLAAAYRHLETGEPFQAERVTQHA